MGQFKIEIVGVGGHGCDRATKTGEKLHGRCGRFGCPDCMAHNFVMELRQRGMLSTSDPSNKAELTHWPGQACQVVDDMLTNVRKEGQF